MSLASPLSGRSVIKPTASTPGKPATRVSSCSKKFDAFSGVLYFCRGKSTRRVKTLFGSNPGSTFCSATKLRMSRPAPINNNTAIALSNTTSKLRVRFFSVASPPPRIPSFKESMRFTFIVRKAGARPNSRPVASDMRRVNARTVASIFTLAVRGILSSPRLTSSLTPATASKAPSAPPKIASKRLSVII